MGTAQVVLRVRCTVDIVCRFIKYRLLFILIIFIHIVVGLICFWCLGGVIGCGVLREWLVSALVGVVCCGGWCLVGGVWVFCGLRTLDNVLDAVCKCCGILCHLWNLLNQWGLLIQKIINVRCMNVNARGCDECSENP